MSNKTIYRLIDSGARSKELLSAIVKNEKDSHLVSVAKLLQQKEINVIVKLAEMEGDDLGIYETQPNGPALIQISTKCKPVTQILLHEYIHAVTYDAVRSGDSASNIYIKRLNEIKQQARMALTKKGIDPNDYYGLDQNSHTEEFVTEVFTNKELRNVLKNIPVKSSRGTKLGTTLTSMYDEIVLVVNDILGGKKHHQPLIKEVMELGAGLMVVDEKYRHKKLKTSGLSL